MIVFINIKDRRSLVVTIIAAVCVFVSMSSCALWAVKQSQVLINNQIALSAGYACFLVNNGVVKCGSGGKKPVPVKGLQSGVKSISAGRAHTCAVTKKGGLKCWGLNNHGQLGDGTTSDQLNPPTEVAGLTENVVAVAPGDSHTCALTTEGKVKCWGLNNNGQLGDGTGIDRTTPVDVKGLEGDKVIQVSAGGGHTCVLTTNREVKCWGGNYYGQLGDNSTEDNSTPVEAINLKKSIKAIEAGRNHTCAITLAGRVKCWGLGFREKVKGSEWSYKLQPVDVSGFKRGVVAISISSNGNCAIMVGGTVKCVGDFLPRGGVVRKKNYFKRPTTVKGIPDPVIALDTYGMHICALTKKGDFYCLGMSPVARTRVTGWKNEAGKVLF